MSKQLHVSIVSPVYKAESSLKKLVTKIHENVNLITDQYEIILVEDGSPDQSWGKIEQICREDSKVKGIKLSRNFGQHPAITAGLQAAQGNWIILMDCDLQDRPEEIPQLYQKALEGYDLVFATRSVRKDNWLKRMSSKVFYRFFSYMTDTSQDHTIANFGIYHHKAIKAVLSMGDYIRYFPTMSQWVGFKKTKLEVQHGYRDEGESSYTWKKLFSLAWNNIIAFSDKPLRLTVKFGLTISLFSFFIGFYYLLQYVKGKIEVLGYASLIVSIWFLSGIIIMVIGITGIYLGKIFEKVKNRPIYIIEKIIN